MSDPAHRFVPMDDEQARAVVSWRYEPPFDVYDLARDPEGPEDMMGSPERRKRYFAALSEDELVGFFGYGAGGRLPGFDYPDDGYLDVGLGLRPDLTGNGLGLGYVRAGLELGQRRFDPAGFRRGQIHVHRTGGADHPFLLMTREA